MTVHATASPAAGPAITPRGDGTLEARVERLVLDDLALPLDGASLTARKLSLRGAVATLAAPAPGATPALHALAIDELALDGVTLRTTAPGDVPKPADGWRLEALGGADGELHAYVTDAAWVVDADIRLPVRAGRIDFNRVTVAHVGPDSSMGVSHLGVYVDAPNGRNYLYQFAAAHPPGVTFERRGALFAARVMSRGAIELPPFVAALIGGVAGAPLGRAQHHVGRTLDRTRLRGELQLGDGAIGTARNHVVLGGRADGNNRIQLAAAVLSHKVALQMPQLRAGDATFELLGWRGRVGAVSGALRMQAGGVGAAAGAPPVVTAEFEQLVLRDVTLARATA